MASNPPPNPRDRSVFPFAVPITILAVIFALVWVFSRILLNVPKEIAVAVALMTALNILITCGIISVRRLSGFAAVFLVIVVAVPVVLGGAAAAKAIKVKIPPKPVPAAKPVVVTAANIQFGSKEIDLGTKDAKIEFENNDSVTHNIHIFQGTDANGQSVFAGDPVSGGAKATYAVGSLPAGSYFFRCDFHPTQMTGTVVVSAKGGSSGSPNALTISAQNIAFNTASLTAKSGSAITVAFDNKDTTPHNFDVVSGPPGYTKPASLPTIAGPGSTQTYNIGSLPAGTYKYQCDLHPTAMTGTLTVQ